MWAELQTMFLHKDEKELLRPTRITRWPRQLAYMPEHIAPMVKRVDNGGTLVDAAAREAQDVLLSSKAEAHTR